jgi:predicted HAD superfamily Cof-like phosphohydrolase
MYCKLVRAFAEATQKLKDKPEMLDEVKVNFIIEMVISELTELKRAETLVDQADAFIDIIYYICHSALKSGIDLDALFPLVHEANMRKLVDGKAVLDKRGKVLKPKGWYGPEEEMQKALNNV